MASKSSFVAGQLLRALALRLKARQASPLTPMHIAGLKNAMTEVPLRSFGSKAKWYCETDADLLCLFNQKFPLPNQTSWTVFRPSYKISMRVISVLRMQDTLLEEWRRLPKVGRFIGEIGSATSCLWEWTLTYRTPSTDEKSGCSRDSRHESDRDTTAEGNRFKLEQFRRRYLPLARRFPWPLDAIPSKKSTAPNLPRDSDRC